MSNASALIDLGHVDWGWVFVILALFGGSIAAFFTDVLRILVSPFHRTKTKEIRPAQIREIEDRTAKTMLVAMRAALAQNGIDTLTIDLCIQDAEAAYRVVRPPSSKELKGKNA